MCVIRADQLELDNQLVSLFNNLCVFGHVTREHATYVSRAVGVRESIRYLKAGVTGSQSCLMWVLGTEFWSSTWKSKSSWPWCYLSIPVNLHLKESRSWKPVWRQSWQMKQVQCPVSITPLGWLEQWLYLHVPLSVLLLWWWSPSPPECSVNTDHRMDHSTYNFHLHLEI